MRDVSMNNSYSFNSSNSQTHSNLIIPLIKIPTMNGKKELGAAIKVPFAGLRARSYTKNSNN